MRAIVPIKHGIDVFVIDLTEILVPWFPAPVANMFLSTKTFEKHAHGRIMETEFDIDAAAAQLIKQYPGLPEELHKKYILRACYAASKFEPGTEVRPVITRDSAMIQDLAGTKHVLLWDNKS